MKERHGRRNGDRVFFRAERGIARETEQTETARKEDPGSVTAFALHIQYKKRKEGFALPSECTAAGRKRRTQRRRTD